MIEVRGNLWEHPANVRVITTNGTVKKNGSAVMGRGCAREAALRYVGLPALLGSMLTEHGNKVHVLRTGAFKPSTEVQPQEALVSFPVKHEWFEEADLDLIKASAEQLVALAGNYDHSTVFVLPRPGCGNGKLSWTNVKPVLESVSGFDDRFHVITF